MGFLEEASLQLRLEMGRIRKGKYIKWGREQKVGAAGHCEDPHGVGTPQGGTGRGAQRLQEGDNSSQEVARVLRRARVRARSGVSQPLQGPPGHPRLWDKGLCPAGEEK